MFVVIFRRAQEKEIFCATGVLHVYVKVKNSFVFEIARAFYLGRWFWSRVSQQLQRKNGLSAFLMACLFYRYTEPTLFSKFFFPPFFFKNSFATFKILYLQTFSISSTYLFELILVLPKWWSNAFHSSNNLFPFVRIVQYFIFINFYIITYVVINRLSFF